MLGGTKNIMKTLLHNLKNYVAVLKVLKSKIDVQVRLWLKMAFYN